MEEAQKEVTEHRWVVVKDGDLRAWSLYARHYSYRRYLGSRRKTRFVGPGEKIVLLADDERALFVWRKFLSKDGQVGVNCAVFRNEGGHLSSSLILEAEGYAWERWSGERLYTYVDPRRVSSSNPGFCFKQAGWSLVRDEQGKPVRTKKKKLLILEKLPSVQASR